MKILRHTFLLVTIIFFNIVVNAQSTRLDFIQSETNYWFCKSEIAEKGIKKATVKVSEKSFGTFTNPKTAMNVTFNEDGLLTSYKKTPEYEILYRLNDTESNISGKIKYRPDGQVVEAEIVDYLEREYSFTNTYEEGKITEQIRTEKGDAESKVKTIYKYYDNGDLALISSKNYSGRTVLGHFYKRYIYNDENNTEIIEGVGKERKKRLQGKVLETRSLNGKIVSKKKYEDFTGEEKEVKFSRVTSYTYDQNGRWLQLKSEPAEALGRDYGNSHPDRTVTITDFEYEGDSKLIKKITVTLFDNPETDEPTIVYQMTIEYE